MKADMFANEGAAVITMAAPAARKRVHTHAHCSPDLKFIFGVCVVAFLLVGVLSRLVRLQWLPGSRQSTTLLEEARTAAETGVEFVSMN
jgi:hypothetical protein